MQCAPSSCCRYKGLPALELHQSLTAQIPINVFELGLKNGLLREPEYVITYADFLLGARLL